MEGRNQGGALWKLKRGDSEWQQIPGFPGGAMSGATVFSGKTLYHISRANLKVRSGSDIF